MLCCKLLGVAASKSQQSSTEFYSSPLHSILGTSSFDIQLWLGSRILKSFPMHPLGSTLDHILSDLFLPHCHWTHELKFLLSLLGLPYPIFMVYILGSGFWYVDFQFKRKVIYIFLKIQNTLPFHVPYKCNWESIIYHRFTSLFVNSKARNFTVFFLYLL